MLGARGVGEELRSRRRALGLSQRALAHALGVAASTVARWERGERVVPSPRMLALALERLEQQLAPAPTPTGSTDPAPDGGHPLPPENLRRLSPREREVSQLLARGLANREIADALTIAPSTAALHAKRVLAKLGFASRAQLAAALAARSTRARNIPRAGYEAQRATG